MRIAPPDLPLIARRNAGAFSGRPHCLSVDGRARMRP